MAYSISVTSCSSGTTGVASSHAFQLSNGPVSLTVEAGCGEGAATGGDTCNEPSCTFRSLRLAGSLPGLYWLTHKQSRV